jgi:hypothetical protein
VVVIVRKLNFQLHVQSVPTTTNVVSSNPVNDGQNLAKSENNFSNVNALPDSLSMFSVVYLELSLFLFKMKVLS